MPTPFTINAPQARLDWIRERVRAYEWHEMPEGAGWEYGANLDYMRAFCAYWVDLYDWRAQERALNRLSHFKARVEDLDLHFLREDGSGPNPQPLLLSHGWPGSFYEFVHIVEPLAHPERFGGAEEDAFTVIAPSLPGYGFSDKPKRPIGPRRIARYLHGLMHDVLRLDGYIAQGGDWGSLISTWIGVDYPDAIRGIHLNMPGLRTPGALPETPEEKAWQQRSSAYFEAESAYFRVQATKPQSLSYAMMDSPVGVAAWIVEKFHTWSDLEGGELEGTYSKDQLLTNIMIYLVTRSFNTASWLYRGLFEEGGGNMLLPEGVRVTVPTGVAAFPHDLITWPPRSLASKTYANIVHWTDMERGGHFAALEEPDLFVADLRAFARRLRG